MDVFISHIDRGPLVYGLVMFFGILVMYVKLLNGSYKSLFWDIVIFTLVFKLHGGTMAGGFSAMVASLLSGLIFPYLKPWR